MTQKLTAAEQYAKLKSDRFEQFLEQSFSAASLKGVDLFEVKVPSGMVFKCRRLDAAFSVNTGAMPIALSEQLLAGKQGDMSEKEKEAAFSAMTVQEQRASIQVAAQMVRYIAVEPRIIVGDVGDRTDAISSDALTMDDFKALASFAQGGDEAPGLKTFRRKR